MHALNARQTALLILLTLVWGINWPILKIGVTGFPPLTFRALSIVLGVPVLAAALLLLKVPFHIARRDWPAMLWLGMHNMFVWHPLIILAVSTLSSGRAAILGYTMPIFSALWGAVAFQNRLSARAWGGVAAASVGVGLLLWHELTQLAGRPAGVALALIAAASWAWGTQLLRHTALRTHTLTLSFWMTTLTAVLMTLLALVFEADRWHPPSAANWVAIVYNAVLVFGFAHAAWFTLARGLPPVASTLSVMFIPVLGVFSGAWWLGETVHWQDAAAVGLMVAAIASVLLPTRRA